ncbi:MAG TPA: molecular chaperone HscC [Bradyrhizobium sp.]|uniref:Hsp70 family protein n=1 Tax=Bradyrhizobium sp. TaxID=376 RepID=UPI002CC88063|nr:molecular chaperone HscC [Bradyrhizobium sp.]HLZ03126.1 molecular chaperone HscC [Bradyrhizobium sp.]
MIVGIDLGTTNSLVGVWRDGAAVLIPNALGHFLTPSAVGIGDDGAILVGLPARERLSTHPARTAAAFKRYMGTDRLLFLADRGYRPEELSALVLRSLKADAEAYLREPVDEAIITVPAYFNDLQRKATKTAGALAGLKVNRLLTEPTAAALAYGLDAQTDDELLLVVDIGGGTFDVSLLHRFEGVMEVRATAGDSWLGGEDFVDAIVAAFKASHGDIPLPLAVLRRQAELAKRKLSTEERATIAVMHDGKSIEWTLDREQFEAICEPLLVRVRAPIERALRDARVEPDALSRIILAGGASQMPVFRRLVARLFRRLPVHQINPEEVVARGAAVRAGMVSRDAALEETVMTDVAPFTLGIEISIQHGERASDRSNGIFMPIIERNTVIPASRSKVVTTIHDNQRSMIVKVFQGEARLVKDNVLLGDLKLTLPPGPAGREEVDVRFTYDSSGLLEVRATTLSTGRAETLVIEGNPGLMQPDEIARRLAALAKLKIHPRDDVQNRALIARAERLFEERLGDDRAAIGDALARFVAALDRQNPEEIDRARRSFFDLIEAIDHSFFI